MMQYRKEKLENEYFYHIFSRSISKYTVFNDPEDFSRIIEIMNLYRYSDFKHKYSKYLQLDPTTQVAILTGLKNENKLLINIVAYCVMSTHIHLILKQLEDNGISHFMAKIFNSYSRYFNVKHKRAGPLWAGRFKSVFVSDDSQLLHLTRYIHLNPTSANLVNKPNEWPYSSYVEYINPDSGIQKLCNFENLFEIEGNHYKKFVLDRKDYQKQLSIIKSLLIDDYTG